MRELGGRGRRPRLRRRLRRVQAPPRRARRRCRLLDPPRRARIVAEVRGAVARACSTAIELDRDDPLLADGFVYGMVVQHEHQHDETMLATIQLMTASRTRSADERLPRRRRRAVRGDVLTSPAGTFAWAPTTSRGRTTTSGRRTRSSSRRSASTPRPVTNGAYAEFVDAGGYDDARTGPTPAGLAARGEASSAQFWPPDGDGSWRRRRFGRDEPCRPTSRCSTCAGTRPTRSRAGPAAPPDRGRVGGARPAARPLPVRATRRSRGRANLATARFGPGAGRRSRDGAAPCASSCSATCGSGRRPTSRRTRASVVPVPRVLGGVLRPRVQGAARRVVGDAPGRGAHHVPQLGLPDPPPDLRRLPLRARTREVSGRVVVLGGGAVRPRRSPRRCARHDEDVPITLVESKPGRGRVLLLRVHAVEDAAAGRPRSSTRGAAH